MEHEAMAMATQMRLTVRVLPMVQMVAMPWAVFRGMPLDLTATGWELMQMEMAEEVLESFMQVARAAKIRRIAQSIKFTHQVLGPVQELRQLAMSHAPRTCM